MSAPAPRQFAAVDRPAAVEVIGISKRYPGVVANDAVTLTFHGGEVHCLLGENGAGKSTLMGILAGQVTPDDGRIMVNGREVRIPSPRRARDLGIGLAPQHAVLVPGLTVLENLMLGDNRGLRPRRTWATARLAQLADLLGITLHPGVQAGQLALGQQQQVAIIKALWAGARVLILDEPTSLLSAQEAIALWSGLVRLKHTGVAIVVSTHRLQDALTIGDRISVLRGGRLIGTLDAATRAPEQAEALIMEMMFGQAPDSGGAPVERQRRPPLPGRPLLELAGITANGGAGTMGVREVTLSVRAGQIVGVAGVEGNGQGLLAAAIAGQQPLTAGEIYLSGHPVGRLGVAGRQRLGLRYVTDDRLDEGIVPSLSVALNLVLTRIGQRPFWRWGRIQQRRIEEAARELITRFDIRVPGVGTPAGALSGGNIQKLLLARALSFDPKVVVYNKPTHGLDVRTTLWVRQRIQAQATAGVAALIISPDLDELLALCDDVAVLSRGRLAGMVRSGPGAAARIGALMVAGSPSAPDRGNG